MALPTAGDQGYSLIDEEGAGLVPMTAEQVGYQLRAIKGMIDGNSKSRPVICKFQGSYYAGALSLVQRGEHAPTARIGHDTAVERNQLLRRILSPWPAERAFFDEEDIMRFEFLALTRTVQAQATEYEARREAGVRIRELEAQLRQAREELAKRPAGANGAALVPYDAALAGINAAAAARRRPTPAGQSLLLAENWAKILADEGPQVLTAAVLAAAAPGGFKDHARHSWERVAGTINACSAVMLQGRIPPELVEEAQRAIDDFVLAAGAHHAGQFMQLRQLWAAKAEGPAGLVAALHRQGRGRGGRGGLNGRGSGRGACYICGKFGHFAKSCRAAHQTQPTK